MDISSFRILSAIFILAVVILSAAPPANTSVIKTTKASNFQGYKVLRIFINNEEQLGAVQALDTKIPSLDFWTDPEVKRNADIMVSPTELDNLIKLLQGLGLEWTVFIEDVGKVLQDQEQNQAQANAGLRNTEHFDGARFWTSYQNLSAIYGWMDQLVANYPAFLSTESIGNSYEGRPVRLLKVSNSSSNSSQPRPAIFFDSGIHAREWISPATVTYIFNQLITDPQYKDIIENADLYFVPVFNVDGYEYTFTTDRMWRKNRRPNPGSSCIGTDLNRNFPFQWCTVGASNNSCSLNFCGEGPGSEPETQLIMNYLSRDINWWGMVTVHSYAQEWCIPWAYTAMHAPDYDDMMAVGRKAVDALEAVHGTQYVLKFPSGRYGGFSMDWAKGVRNIKYPVLIELRDTGAYGFLLPPAQIIPSGEETLAAIAVYLREIIAEARITYFLK